MLFRSKRVFGGDHGLDQEIERHIQKLNTDLRVLVDSVAIIEDCSTKLKRITVVSQLIDTSDERVNPLKLLLPNETLMPKIELTETTHLRYLQMIEEIERFLTHNPFTNSMTTELSAIRSEINKAYDVSNFEQSVRKCIIEAHIDYESLLCNQNMHQQITRQQIDALMDTTRRYTRAYVKFKHALSSITAYSFRCRSQSFYSAGHKLEIQNNFALTKEKVIDVMNNYLKTRNKLSYDVEITPAMLYSAAFKDRPMIADYNDFHRKVYTELAALNEKSYKITTNDGRDFDL